jgi:small subunit ribosomal protein S6
MIKYEMVFVADARLSDGEKNELSRQVSDLIVKFGGKVNSLAVWMERQRFSFPMKKVVEGTYFLTNYEMPPDGAAKLRRDLQINEKVLRFLIIKDLAKKSA